MLQRERQMKLLAFLLAILLCVTVGRSIYLTQAAPVAPLPLGGIIAPPSTQAALPSDGERININTADQAALELLPGIGPVKSKAILKYREEKGAFHNINELMQVKGIGEKTFRKVQEYVCVE